jgi:hypothetical protein
LADSGEYICGALLADGEGKAKYMQPFHPKKDNDFRGTGSGFSNSRRTAYALLSLAGAMLCRLCGGRKGFGFSMLRVWAE